MAERMLDKYGRVPVARMVAAFYADMLQSPKLGLFFRDVSMSTLVEHQTLFMQALFFRDVSMSTLVEHQTLFMQAAMGGPKVIPTRGSTRRTSVSTSAGKTSKKCSASSRPG